MTSDNTGQAGGDYRPCTDISSAREPVSNGVPDARSKGAHQHLLTQVHPINVCAHSGSRLIHIGNQHRRCELLNGFVLRQEDLPRQLIEEVRFCNLSMTGPLTSVRCMRIPISMSR